MNIARKTPIAAVFSARGETENVMSKSFNRPGRPANPPQHLPSDHGGDGKPSDADSPENADPNEPSGSASDRDPHPDSEEGYDRDSKIPVTGL